VEQLTQLLGLTSAQSQQLDAILLQGHTEAKTIHDQTDAQIEHVRQKGRDQVRAILTPEQKPKFEEFLKDLDQKRKHSGSK
jgi:Spy/CpxP family protein refolding chaperone